MLCCSRALTDVTMDFPVLVNGPQDVPEGLLQSRDFHNLYGLLVSPSIPQIASRFAFAEGVAQDPWHKSHGSEFMGFPKLLPGVASIRV